MAIWYYYGIFSLQGNYLHKKISLLKDQISHDNWVCTLSSLLSNKELKIIVSLHRKQRVIIYKPLILRTKLLDFISLEHIYSFLNLYYCLHDEDLSCLMKLLFLYKVSVCEDRSWAGTLQWCLWFHWTVN